MARASSGVDMRIDRESPVTIPEQIVRGVREAVADGRLRCGQAFPSTRALAAQLAISRGSVVAAYEQLVAEGFLVARARSGIMVHPDVRPAKRAVMPAAPAPKPTRTVLDLVPGHESAVPINDAAWRAAVRQAVAPPARSGWSVDPTGDPGVRTAIADHLRVMRAMSVPIDLLTVTAGARDGLRLVLDAVGRTKGRPLRVAAESPGFPGLRGILRRGDVELVELAVDRDQLDTSRLGRVDVALLTPNHQFPYGAAMPAPRRQQLLDWAVTAGALIVEDDYDSEFRHLGPALPSLWSLDPAKVVHLGTFTGVLGRDVGTGYLISPADIHPSVREVRAELGNPVAPVTARAVGGYLDNGGLRRRIARGRQRLNAVRRVVRTRLCDVAGAIDTGHLVVVECSESRARRIRQRCEQSGLLIGDLADGWAGRSSRHGVVLSYGNTDPDPAERAMRILARAYDMTKN